MYFRLIVLLCLLMGFHFTPLSAQTQFNFSDSTRVSLLTCSPGDALYSTFGHSAVRVYDPLSGMDAVFNWGIFDFDTPNFYWKFMRGHHAGANGMMQKIDLEIQVPPAFPAQYHDALIRSAELCKVKKHLENPPAFEITTMQVEMA